MTGSEIADALSASRSRAIAALGKAYVRRTEEPDDELFKGLLDSMGLADDVATEWLLAAWRILRQQRADAPAENGATRSQEPEPASERQQTYLAKLADEKGFTAPHMAGMTKARASELIDKLQKGTYAAETDDVPF